MANADPQIERSALDAEEPNDSDVGGGPSAPVKGVHGKNSAMLTAGIIVADVVGAGILGMPRAVREFGWLLGALVMAVMLAANVHISLLLWRVRVSCKGCDGSRTYIELCRGCFSRAPRWQRNVATITTGVSQYSFLFCLMGIYLLSAGKGMGMVFNKSEICLPQWAGLAGVLLLPFAGTARKMGSYKSLVWINITTLSGTVLIPLGWYVSNGAEGVRDPDSQIHAINSLNAVGVLSGLSTFSFGMTSQFMLTEIISEMKDPMELPKAYVKISAPFQLCAFMIAGLGGYYFLGDKAVGMINDNLPFNTSFQVAATCLVIHMLISYLIKGVVFDRAFLEMVKVDYADPDDKRKRALAAWNAIVIPTLFCAWLVANLVPFFGDFVDLLGASLTPLSCWILPIAMFMRYYVDEETKPAVSVAEWLCMACETVLALVLMFLGTYTSIQTLRTHWHEYGYPFQCHCEGLWSTCACSSDHVGMDMCRIMSGNTTAR